MQGRRKIGLNCMKKCFGWEIQTMISELLCYYSKSEIEQALNFTLLAYIFSKNGKKQ